MVCIELPDTELYIYGDRMTADFKAFNIEFYPCSLPNPGDCVSGADLGSLMIVAIGAKSYLQNSDFDNPIKNGFHLTEELNMQMMQGRACLALSGKTSLWTIQTGCSRHM